MLLTPALRPHITSTADPAQIRDQAYRDGMKSLRIGGALKVAQGMTTVEEVLKAAPPASSERRRAST